MATPLARENELLDVLCNLTLNQLDTEPAIRTLQAFTNEERKDLVSMAESHHVILRGLTPVLASPIAGEELKNWAAKVILNESNRITNALFYLQEICSCLERSGCKVTVMKSLDHWPDLGNDLDLYTTADEDEVRNVLVEKFKATIQ